MAEDRGKQPFRVAALQRVDVRVADRHDLEAHLAGLGRGYDDVRRSQVVDAERDRGLAADGLARARRPAEAGFRLRHARPWRRWFLAALVSARRCGASARLRAKTVDVRRGRSISISLAAILRTRHFFTSARLEPRIIEAN